MPLASETRLANDKDPTAAARSAMAAAVELEVVETARWLGKDKLDPAVIAALARVPRHRFVPEHDRAFAYENRPLPIGHRQTISQPYIVALMTDLAAVKPSDRVLEVGTGCGYQAAILAELAKRVYSIETVPELAAAAAERLAALGYDTIEVRHGDGAQGWPEAAPFDAILVTAAAQRRIPPALLEQLAPGGRLVIPLERGAGALTWAVGHDQELLLVVKDEAGELQEKSVIPVAFVPLVERRG
jgi:protein-L-isoaspartate(D-aspartate) O-methyltransferase